MSWCINVFSMLEYDSIAYYSIDLDSSIYYDMVFHDFSIPHVMPCPVLRHVVACPVLSFPVLSYHVIRLVEYILQPLTHKIKSASARSSHRCPLPCPLLPLHLMLKVAKLFPFVGGTIKHMFISNLDSRGYRGLFFTLCVLPLRTYTPVQELQNLFLPPYRGIVMLHVYRVIYRLFVLFCIAQA